MLDVTAAPVMGTDSAPSAVEECDGHKAEFNDESIEGGAAGLEGAWDEVILMVGLHAVLYPLAVNLHLERMITFTSRAPENIFCLQAATFLTEIVHENT